jgi:UDP-glucuronate decarboxylase
LKIIDDGVKKIISALEKEKINFSGKNILITGGAGFLGSWTCDVLVRMGANIICVDNLASGLSSNISHLLQEDSFKFIEHDISKPLYIDEKLDIVMHMASRASPFEFEKYPIQILKANTMGIWVALGIAKKHKARFLYTSTSEVYGDPDPRHIPTPETYNGNVNPIGPRSCYDESKRAGEAFVKAYELQHGLDTMIVRIFNSILEDQPVVVFNDGEAHIQSIGEYVKKADFKNRIVVPSFEPRTCKMVLREVSHVIKHPYKGDAYEIETTYGRKVRVTGDHSVFTVGDDLKPKAVPVRSLKVGDKIAVPARLPVVERDIEKFTLSEILIKICSEEELWNFAVYHPKLKKEIRERRAEIYEFLCNSGHFKARQKRSIWGNVYRYINSSTLPLPVVKELSLDIPDSGKIKICWGGKQILVPNIIKVSGELLWLLGFFIAEGSYAKIDGKNYAISFSSDEYLLEKAKKILENIFNVNVVIQHAKNGRSPAIYAHSKLLLFLFERIFKVLDGRVPPWIFQLPLSKLKYFLEGYREGDGTHSGRALGKQLDFNTTNESLALDILYILLRFGIVAMVRKYKTTYKEKYGSRKFPFYRISIRGLSNYNILEWDSGVSQNLNRKRTGDLVWVIVKKIRKVKTSKFVYDFSVPGTENFIAGWGISCHNTYGPRMRAGDIYGRVVPRFITQALNNEPITVFGDGSQTRSFTYVTDQIEGILRLAAMDARGEVVNIGNNIETSIIELARLIKKLTNSKSEITFHPLPADDPKRRCPDISKARHLLNWKPKVTLEEGIKNTIKWFEMIR